MSPIYNTGGGATASNSVAATKEETPTGTKIMIGRFNNDMSAGNKNSLSITTSRTTPSAPPPIELDRYYCRRNWYIDINGYHQFHTSYDKIVINNKNKNNNVNNEEHEDSELHNKDVNNEYEVIITPNAPRQGGVSKERDSSGSVATKKDMPSGKKRTGGIKNNAGNKKSTTPIITKSIRSSPPLHNNKYGSYNRFDEQDCSLLPKRNKGVPKEHNNSSGPYKDNIHNTPPCKEGVPTHKHNVVNTSMMDNVTPPLNEGVRVTNDENADQDGRDINKHNSPKYDKSHDINKKEYDSYELSDNLPREGVGFIWYEHVPFDIGLWIPVKPGVSTIINKKKNTMMASPHSFVTPTNNVYAVLSEDNDDDDNEDNDDDDDNLNSPVSVVKQEENDNSFENSIASKEEEGSINSNAFASNSNINHTDVILNNNNVTTGHTVKTIRSNNSTSTDAVQHNKGNEGDNEDDTVFHPPDKNNNTTVPSEKGNESDDEDDTVFHPPDKNNNTTVPSEKGVVPNNKERTNKIKMRTDDSNCDMSNNNTIVSFEEGAQSNTCNDSDVVDPFKKGVGKKQADMFRSNNDTINTVDPSKTGVGDNTRKEKGARGDLSTNNNNTNGNTNNPSKEEVRVVDNNHGNNDNNTNGDTNNPSKKGVRVVDNNHDKYNDAIPPGLQGLDDEDNWSTDDSCDSCYDDGETGIHTNSIKNNTVLQPVDNDHSKIGVSGKEQINRYQSRYRNCNTRIQP